MVCQCRSRIKEGTCAYHCQVDALFVLEGIKQLHEPFALRCCQDIPLCQNMSDFVQFEQKLLAHHFQCTDFPSILLRCEIDLPIAALPNLGKDLEVPMA